MPDWGELQVDQLRFMARQRPGAAAYRNLDADTAITFGEWDAASNALARGLVALGVAKGDRVSILLPSDGVLRWIAAFVALLALAGTIRCWLRMGDDWRMDVGLDGQGTLITDGPFARIRHPIYALSVLLMLWTVVIVPTAPMLVIAAVHIALMNMKARNEERHLLAVHGDAYARYLQRTGRFFPRLTAHSG